MNNKKRKTAVIGCGLVGMSYIYSSVIEGVSDEIVMIDINKKRLTGEMQDISHGISFASKVTEVYMGDYSDLKDADIVVLSAGVSQAPGEGRISLLRRNKEVFASIVPKVMASGFSGIFLVATNPVDLMSLFTKELSGMPSKRVIGSGTMLDTARLKFKLGEYFSVDPKSVHAYVMGEHGDSEFVPWSSANIATKRIYDIVDDSNGRFSFSKLQNIEKDVRDSALEIIAAKGATYYGIGMALSRLTSVIYSDDKSILTVSAMLSGEYGEVGIYSGVPSVVGADGIYEIIELKLLPDEEKKFHASCEFLKETYKASRV